MLILVANLGSTSFKYRLFRMDESGGEVVAKGGYERVENYAAVIDDALATLQRDGVITSPDEIQAVGFKTVLGKNLSGCVIADQTAIDALEGFAAVALQGGEGVINHCGVVFNSLVAALGNDLATALVHAEEAVFEGGRA
jgi:acetate kinase